MDSRLEQAAGSWGTLAARSREGVDAKVAAQENSKVGTLTEVLLVSAWFGLFAGLLESIVSVALRGVPGFAVRVSTEILWIAPAVDLVLFTFLGIGFALLSLTLRKTISFRWLASLLTAATLLGLLLLLGKLNQFAALILSVGVAVQMARMARGKEAKLLSFFKRTTLVLLISTVLAGMGGAFWATASERYSTSKLPPPTPGAPNVLLITLDTLRADHLSLYGYKRETSPNLARLAERGVLFESAFANSSWTLPSHASLFTGLLPHEHKADWTTPLSSNYRTLAQALAERGYLTAAFAANISYATPEWGMARGFQRYEAHGSSLAEDITSTVYGKKLALNLLPRIGHFDIPGRKTASEINHEFLSWLNQKTDRPFFAFLNYFDLHDPYLSSGPYRTQFAANPTRGDVINFQFQANSFRRKSTVTKEELNSEIDSYDACLANLDSKLGELMEELQRRGLDKNTLIIITSDHGEALGEHDLYGHGNSLYLESLRVPLLIVFPGQIPAGVRVAEIASLHDVPATVMDLLNQGHDSFPGESLGLFWTKRNNPAPATAAVVSELSPGRFKDGPVNYPTTKGSLKSIVTSEWHLIVSDSGETQLFAWRRDPQESNNLAETSAGRVIADELKQQLLKRVPLSNK